jgi:hypothetical protein
MGNAACYFDGKWLGRRPLCRSYLLVALSTIQVTGRADSDERCWPVTWALGTLSDGSHEALGAWHRSVDGPLDSDVIFAALALRGVERVRYATDASAGAAPAELPSHIMIDTFLPVSAVSHGSPWLSSSRSTGIRRAGGAAPDDSRELTRRVRQLVLRSEKAARVLQRGLTQAAIRHGPFETGSSATSFVEMWLAKAEHHERRRRFASQHRAAVTPAVLAQ